MQHFPNNSKTQLKSYFQKQLRTGSIYFKWTAEDEQMLIQAAKQYGNNWEKVQKLFPACSVSQLSSKFQNMVRKENKQQKQKQTTNVQKQKSGIDNQ